MPHINKPALLLFASLISTAAHAATYSVSFNDPDSGFSPELRAQIESHVLAAAQLWDSRIQTHPDASIEIEVFRNIDRPSSGGRSMTSVYFGVSAKTGLTLYEGSGPYELRTGNDPNGSTPDIQIITNEQIIADKWWFDPDPTSRTAPMAAFKLDAMSVIMHELGHALGFNGWNSNQTGLPTQSYQSLFDEHMDVIDGDIYFTGPNAVNTYGGPVPLTTGNAHHLGNNAPLPGDDLIPDLMNGVVFTYATRYEITALNLAILEDLGLVPPAPPVCPCEVNADGATDFFDLLDFLDLWFQSAPDSDFNSDGRSDFFDLLDFLDCWFPASAGHPCQESAPEATHAPALRADSPEPTARCTCENH